MNFINYDVGGIVINKGIKLVREFVFEISLWKGVIKVVFVIMDGLLDFFKDMINEVKIIKEVGIVVFVFGIGNINKVELKVILSLFECIYVILLVGFLEIDNVV